MFLDTVRYETDVDYNVASVTEWHQVEGLIRQLDGEVRTDLMLSSSQDKRRQMIVMGGGDHYVVSAHLPEGVFLVEQPDEPKEEFIELVLGGNCTEVPKALAVPLAAALQAAKTFCSQGVLESGLLWHQRRGPT